MTQGIVERLDADDIRVLLRTACVTVGSQRAFAQKWRISDAFVSDVLSGRREPSKAILDALGLEREVTYRRPRQSP
jgi:hypothetical protein